jgi:hypothetical protein
LSRNLISKAARFSLIAATVLFGSGTVAVAVPDLAAQTGEPCTRCHIGGFGPQLTPFGRAFKIGGYTQGGGEGLASKIPLSAMVQSSFNNTGKSQAQPDGTRTNNNFSIDQISLFVAGRVGEHTGGFMQLTWSDVTHFGGTSTVLNVDNTDLRPYTTLLTIGEDTDLRLGTTINNNPTVQDPYNTTPAWGFPYISSQIAPGPTAAPVLERFGGSTIGYTVYAWYDRKLYLEAGAYTTPSAWLLTRFGDGLDPGAIVGGAPYLRAAYEWNWNAQSAHVGALYFSADVNPQDPFGNGKGFASTGVAGQDHYTDYAFDAGYQFLGDGTHIVTAQAIYIHEDQRLNATQALGGDPTLGNTFHLDKINANVSYWYQNTYGVTLGWTKTWGSANPFPFLAAGSTSVNNKPNSNAFTIEADWVPFGKANSLYNPFLNLKLGVQYTAYTQFDGGSSNFDGAGRNASDNNTLLAFAWLAF